MVRPTLLAAGLLLACPGALSAEPGILKSSYVVDRVSETRMDAVVHGRVEGAASGFYGGVRAETVPQPDDPGNVAVYFGMRPRVGDVAMDVSYTRNVEAPCCGGVALNVGRDVGARGRFGARVYFDAAGDTAETEARASVTVSRGLQVAGGVGSSFSARDLGEDTRMGFDLGLTRQLSDLCLMDLRYRDAIAAAARAQMSLEVRF